MINTDIIKQWIELGEQKAKCESDTDEIKERMKSLEEAILENFASEGVDAFKINGVTISPRKQIFATILDGDKKRAHEALRIAGYGQYVVETCNMKSLSTLVSDLINEDGKLPDTLTGAIGIYEKMRLSKRKS